MEGASAPSEGTEGSWASSGYCNRKAAERSRTPVQPLGAGFHSFRGLGWSLPFSGLMAPRGWAGGLDQRWDFSCDIFSHQRETHGLLMGYINIHWTQGAGPPTAPKNARILV